MGSCAHILQGMYLYIYTVLSSRPSYPKQKWQSSNTCSCDLKAHSFLKERNKRALKPFAEQLLIMNQLALVPMKHWPISDVTI